MVSEKKKKIFSRRRKIPRSKKSKRKILKHRKVKRTKKNRSGSEFSKYIKPISKTLREIKKQSINVLESEILDNPVIESEILLEKKGSVRARDMLEQIMFRLPWVSIPLIGTPKQVREELDSLVKKMQKEPENDSIFDKIHLYMHGYLINVVLKKFPFIKGFQTVDIYQETLIALRFKAIPNFKQGKGMSFLNFAKMCIRRHLITLLNLSKTRKKDQSMNQAISLDSSPVRGDDDENKTTYANIIADNKDSCDKTIATNEAYEVTKKSLLKDLSSFEKVVLNEYLANSSYKEISKNLTKKLHKKYNTKSIDNALLRIRKKAVHLMKYGKKEDLPIFMQKNIV